MPASADLPEDDPMLEERFLQSLDDYDNARRAEGFVIGFIRGFAMGFAKGLADSGREYILEIVRSMLADGLEHVRIARYTGLSRRAVAILAADGCSRRPVMSAPYTLPEDGLPREERFLQSFDDYDRARRAEGIGIGFAEIDDRIRQEIALALLEAGMDHAMIALHTGLSPEEVEILAAGGPQ